jgi:hypothetical protein
VSLRSAAAPTLCFALCACHLERGPNVAGVFGPWIAHARNTVDAGTVGGVSAQLDVVEIGEDVPFILKTSGALSVGANSVDVGARLDAGGELGYAPELSRGHHLFMRGGLWATLEADPYTAHLMMEIPTATVGYAYHPRGDGIAEAMHFEIGAHGGLVAAMLSRVDSHLMERYASAEIGPTAHFNLGAFSSQVGYVALFRGGTSHLIRSSTCVGIGFVACVDTRHMTLPEFDLGMHGYVGVSVGIGWVAGVFPR